MRADRPDATLLQSPCALSCPTLSARAARRTRAVPAVPVGSGPLRRPRVAPVRAGRGSDLPHALRRAARSRDPGVGGRAEPRECAKGSGDPRNSPRRGSCDAVFHPPPPSAPHVGGGFQKSRGTARPLVPPAPARPGPPPPRHAQRQPRRRAPPSAPAARHPRAPRARPGARARGSAALRGRGERGRPGEAGGGSGGTGRRR